MRATGGAESPSLLTVQEAAERLRVSEDTVRRRIREGALPALQLGGRRSPVRIVAGELDAWLYGEARDGVV